MLDMPRVREVFEASTDFTVGIEEEFAILDPETLSLDQRFEELRDAAQDDPVLAESVAGELITSEIEIRSGRGENFADAVARQRDAALAAVRARGRAGRAARRHGHPSVEPVAGAADHRHRALPPRAGAACSTSRGATTPSALHVHVGVRGAERAVRRVRPAAGGAARAAGDLRQLAVPRRARLAASTRRARRSSRRASRAAASRTRSAAWQAYADYVDFLRTDELDRRAHPALVERAAAPLVRHGRDAHLRRAGERRRVARRWPALIVACVAQAALDHDEGVPFERSRRAG